MMPVKGFVFTVWMPSPDLDLEGKEVELGTSG
jgi:uncharacterized metal-binding protein